MTAVLAIEEATKNFGGLTAVDRVSLAMEKGEVVGLLGPNGSGKTTLMNLVSGALKPTSGRIAIAGRDLTGVRADRIAKAGVARTFQLVRVLPSLTLTENVMVPAIFARPGLALDAAREVARDVLDRVGLASRAEASAAELTYIDQKRLELARALAAAPDLLLLDEWLAGLEPADLREGIALIRRLQGEGLTILLVEHIMDAVRALCPRVAVMNAGRLVADGPTEDVLARPDVIAAYLGTDDA